MMGSTRRQILKGLLAAPAAALLALQWRREPSPSPNANEVVSVVETNGEMRFFDPVELDGLITSVVPYRDKLIISTTEAIYAVRENGAAEMIARTHHQARAVSVDWA